MPTDAGKLWTHIIKTDPYQKWEKWPGYPGVYSGKSPHGAKKDNDWLFTEPK